MAYVVCRECGDKFKRITWTHLKGHNMSVCDYRKKYPGSELVSKTSIEKLRKSLKGKKFSEEHKCNISISLTGRRLSEEHRKNIGIGHTGNVLSTDTKHKIREARFRRKKTLGYINSPETRKKLSIAQTERFKNNPVSEETKRKMRASHLGIPKPPFTEAHRESLRRVMKEKVARGEFVSWNKGKTKETDERVRRGGQSISNSYSMLTEKEKQERLKNSMFKASQKPNISEQILLGYLTPLGFMYTGGDNNKKIAGHKPDFAHMKYPLLIEYDGPAGHDPSIPWVPENQAEIDDRRDEDYRGVGKKRVENTTQRPGKR